MGRPKRYASEAEKQAAYRERKKMTAVPVLAEPTKAEICDSDNQTRRGGEARGSTSVTEAEPIVVAKNSRGGSHPSIPEREWKYALERAERAKRYAEMFPGFVKPSEVKYQDPLWQWENEVRGRFGGIIGGSLSGSRGVSSETGGGR